MKFEINRPPQKQITTWLERFEKDNNLNLEYTKNTLLKSLDGLSFSDLNEFGLDIKRQNVLSIPNSNMRNIVKKSLDNMKFQYSIMESGAEVNEW